MENRSPIAGADEVETVLDYRSGETVPADKLTNMDFVGPARERYPRTRELRRRGR